jgi:hypothetical protein
MENLNLSISINDGKFQIWENLPEGGFFCCEDTLSTNIKHPQQLAEIIHKAITDPEILFKQLREKGLTTVEGEPIVITISNNEVIFTRGNIVRLWRSDDFDLPVINAELSCGRKIIFKGTKAITFLNHFPYTYFENAKNLAELYQQITPFCS